MVPAGNKAERLSLVNHTTKTIHHHHSARMRENVDQNNSEYGHFLRSDFF